MFKYLKKMISFLVSLLALVLGYLLYGRFVEKVFGPDDRVTPAVAKADGMDYIVLPSWKVFMIQFLNIAGTGPIFGAIMGAKFGPVSYLWIVFGCIFAGAVHDYLSGMLSMRHDGAGLPELGGLYLGKATKKLMLVFTVLLLIMVGTVFVYSPAEILHTISGDTLMWVAIIFCYYIIATMLPIDKIIGKIYPLFAFSLLFMAGALMVWLFLQWPVLPELWTHTGNLGQQTHPDMFKDEIFPALFITIACGAISGFHGTQSPLMARCVKSEKMGRPIFYGAMITEGVVALIWATVAAWFFYGDSGDTAFRSARLIVAEWLKLNQRPIMHRLYICIPLFAISIAMLVWQIENPDGFNTIWQYFGWSNQALSAFTLWTLTVYLVRNKKPFWITLIPALFMTTVCSTFLMVSKIAFNLPGHIGYPIGLACLVVAIVWFCVWYKKEKNLNKKD